MCPVRTMKGLVGAGGFDLRPPLNWTTQSRVASVPMVISNSIPVDVPFDQTNGYLRGIAAVNLFSDDGLSYR